MYDGDIGTFCVVWNVSRAIEYEIYTMFSLGVAGKQRLAPIYYIDIVLIETSSQNIST